MTNLFYLGRYLVTVISESLSVILWNIRPIDSRYSLIDLFGVEMFKIDDFGTVLCAWCLWSKPPQHGACGGLITDLSGTTMS